MVVVLILLTEVLFCVVSRCRCCCRSVPVAFIVLGIDYDGGAELCWWWCDWRVRSAVLLPGGEAVIPGLKAMVDIGSELGIENYIFGMAHR